MNVKNKIGQFIVEMLIGDDGISYTLWVSDVQDPQKNTKAFEFIGVEAGSVINTLDNVYSWIDSLGYSFTKSEIIVFNLPDFILLLGKQGEESLWCRDFCHYVSYFAGCTGMTYSDASDALIRPLFGLTGVARYIKMVKIFLHLRSISTLNRNFMVQINQILEAKEGFHKTMSASGLAENIWRPE